MTAVLLAVTIIGLPFAWAPIKLAGLALWPIGNMIVPIDRRLCSSPGRIRQSLQEPAGLCPSATGPHLGAYCISPLPNDQSSRPESTRLIQMSCLRTPCLA
jgi:inner membrane component-like transport protein